MGVGLSLRRGWGEVDEDVGGVGRDGRMLVLRGLSMCLQYAQTLAFYISKRVSQVYIP